MANIKSAKKRILIERERRVQNNSVKSEIKTYIKKFKDQLNQDVAVAEETYKTLKANCEKAHKNILSVETYCEKLIEEYDKLVKRWKSCHNLK